jgi:hypothetical protein
MIPVLIAQTFPVLIAPRQVFVWTIMNWRPTPPKRPLDRLVPNPKLRFLDQCREVCRFKRFARRTEEEAEG